MRDNTFLTVSRSFQFSILPVLAGLLILGSLEEAVSQNPVKGTAFIVVDGTHRKILASENADVRRPIGDLTKVATAAVVFDWLAVRGGDRNSKMVVPSTVSNLGPASILGLMPGDEISVRDALFAMLLASDNASALTLADYIGQQMIAEVGGNDPVDVFVAQMNALAASEGMTKTTFINPHGLEPVQGTLGLSTAKDMARLAFYAAEITDYNFVQSQSRRRVSYWREGRVRAFNLKNSNRILGHHGVETGKATAMPRAGQCLLVNAKRPDRIEEIQGSTKKRRIPYRLVTVTLNSPDKFAHTASLINQGWAAYEAWVAGGLIVRDPAELLRDSSLAQR